MARKLYPEKRKLVRQFHAYMQTLRAKQNNLGAYNNDTHAGKLDLDCSHVLA